MSEQLRRTRVVIADDNEDVRALLRYTLDLDGRFEVVGHAADGAEAVAQVIAERPEAIVLDLSMPVVDGLSAIASILEEAPAIRIVVLSGFGADGMAEEALRRGAHAFLEKGATFTELTTLLADVCAVGRTSVSAPVTGALAVPTLVYGPEVGPFAARSVVDVTAAVRHEARDQEQVMRRARWFGVIFCVLEFQLYKPPRGTQVPFAPLAVGLAIAACLVAVNVISLWASRRTDERGLYRLGFLELGADTGVVIYIVWLFAFDPSSALWALLIIPVLEGAVRGRLRGAFAAWGAIAIGYAAREVWAANVFHSTGHAFAIDSVLYRCGILFIVAMTTGSLARNFADQTARHAAAQTESEQRARLLGLVAAAGRTMAALDADTLLDAVVDASVALGFDGVELCVFDESSRTWVGTRQRGMPEREGRESQPIDDGVAGAVRAGRETLVVGDYAAWAGGLDESRAAGFRTTAGTPIWSGDEVLAALVVGTKKARSIGAHEIECLELLAAQAGVGLANVRLLEQIRHQALHDALTGLPNQLLFEDRVVQALGFAGRSSERVALMFLDLDRFKKVNDSLGHDFGNELLKQVAGRLLGAVRKCDTVARMGGDEFTLLLPGVLADDDVTIISTKVVEAFREPFVVGHHEMFITPSIGIALYPNDGLGYETLLKHADIAMYRAKAQGGNGCESYGGLSADSTYPRLALEADLHNAIAGNELRVLYQPIVQLSTDRIVGVEALVRWEHRSLGTICPDEFIPLAEEAGLVTAIDAWVLNTACGQLRAWSRAGLPPLRMAVNMSGRHLQHPRMCEGVRQTLRAWDISPALIELEVTEGVAVAEMAGCRIALESLRASGITVAIDDFGTGYSMLSRLRQFPLDTLKIDKSFVQEICGADDEAPIVAATIAMAHSLGLVVVAEGVETPEQLGYLRREGCDLAQGYLLSRPVTAEAIADVLRASLTVVPLV